MKRLRGFVSDMDGVVADTESITFEAMKRFMAQYGRRLDRQTYKMVIGVNRGVTSAILKREFGLPMDEAYIAQELKCFFGPLYADVSLNDGYADLLDYLDEKRIPMALVSASWREKVDSMLAGAGIKHRFSATFSSDEAKDKKTAYILAAASIGILPSECFALEDSPTGLRAAASAGLYCVVVPGTFYSAEEFPPCDEIYTSISEFMERSEMLRGLNGQQIQEK